MDAEDEGHARMKAKSVRAGQAESEREMNTEIIKVDVVAQADEIAHLGTIYIMDHL